MTRSHDLLGVAPGASKEELKKAYRKMVKVWHPDHFTHDPSLQAKAELKLQEINHAFEELTTASFEKPVASAAASEPARHVHPAPVMAGGGATTGGPWPLFILLALIVAPVATIVFQSSVRNIVVDPGLYSQSSDLSTETGIQRYSLNSPS